MSDRVLFGELFGSDESDADQTEAAVDPEPEPEPEPEADLVPGLAVRRGVLDDATCAQYFDWLSREYFSGGRRANQGMHFGALTDSSTPLGCLAQLAGALPGLLPESVRGSRRVLFDQAIVNMYDSDEGIGDHIDLLRFADGIVGFSFGGAATMRLRPVARGRDRELAARYAGEAQSRDPREVSVRLCAGDVYAMSGPARFAWTHGFPRSVDGAPNVAARRISVTLRKLCADQDRR
ncbi:hypothetical protein H4R18_000740 [Coemansia javaensis]|uniref:Fe2OG dioxygenase domain-containing protein n=1 Tax=Coemansia javaensis TaxID=2761396 RepID=A0A9W8LMK0_9FUNG|nr:hypothetical protein H4R18_000740 [Coemansia javaensis]